MTSHIAQLTASELEGIEARLIEVEVDLNAGLHSFNIVGLADKALNEARERVNSALKNAGVKPPNQENRKITINLAPADVKKTGSQYDLPIALGYLLATDQVKKFETGDKLFVGELALDGRVRPVNGILSIALEAARRGYKFIFVPEANAQEAAAVDSIRTIGCTSLRHTLDMLEGKIPLNLVEFNPVELETGLFPDFAEIKGQPSAKRAAIIAAAGGHNLLMIGPPGVGKSMLAAAMAGILPQLTREEAMEVTRIYSAAGLNTSGGLIARRPFRSPHHTASLMAIVGGGTDPRPGEISLAHRGILFLDELPEFQKSVLESMRQPLESGLVNVARVRQSLNFPAKFTLVAAMNPCPCGYYGDEEKECSCAPHEVRRYQKKISGPLLDRIDLQLNVGRVAIPTLRQPTNEHKESEQNKALVAKARALQRERFAQHQYACVCNAELSSRQAEKSIQLTRAAESFIDQFTKNKLSPRAYYRILKTAQTIADLVGSSQVDQPHLSEAYSYRLREDE